MRRRLIAVLMMLLFLLSACSKKGKDGLQAAMDFRTALLQTGGCSFTAQLRADIHDRVYDVTLRCACRTDGSADITVLAPETIEGITATVNGKTGTLSFDGVSLDFGLFDGTELAPIEVPALLCEYWQAAYIASAGWVDGLLQATFQDDRSDDGITVDTWFDTENIPTRAELSVDGNVIAVLTLTDVLVDGG